MYRIERYKEEYLEDHVRIGASIYNQWPMGGQTKIDQLREAYSKDDFDPETRLYAFERDEMVGFITCAMRDDDSAFFEFPYVVEEHREAEDLLIQRAMEVLKGKGAKKLVARAGEYWGRSGELARAYGFTKTEDLALRGEVTLNYKGDTITDRITDEILNYTAENVEEKHRDALTEYIRGKVPDERIETMVNNALSFEIGKEKLNPWDIPYSISGNLVVVKDSEVIGRLVSIQNRNFGERTHVLISYYARDEKVRDVLIGRMSEKYPGWTLIVHTGPWGIPEESLKDLTTEFRPVLSYFEKEI